MRTQRGPLAFRSRTSPAFQSCATRDRIGRSSRTAHSHRENRFTEEALLPGGGDALVVTWVGQVARVASFPIETPGCPTDPADERAAEQATTTLGAP